MNKNAYIIILLGLLLGSAKGQNPIDIQIILNEPYPTELDYYLANSSNMFITTTNTSTIDQQVYYHVRLVGLNNGFDAQTKISFKPLEPVLLQAGYTKFYRGDEMEADFPFSYPEDVDLVSVTPEQLDYIAFNNALPEGTYQICITARDWNTDIALNFQCSDEFSISYGDIPYIYAPYMEEVIPANGSNHITIGWEPPFTLAPPPGTFTYNLKMVDITDDQFGDIELMMNNAALYKLDVEMLSNTIYNYDFPPEIELEEGRRYALRVQAVDQTGTFPLSNNGYSELSYFWYGYNASEQGDDGGNSGPNENQSDCYLNCYYEDNIPENAIASTDGLIEIYIGNFTVTNLEFTNSNGSSASGTGSIEVPFLNDAGIDVTFTNISINTQGRVYQGTINAVKEQVYDPTQMTSTLAEEMNNFIRNGRVASSVITGQGSTGLPFGLIQNIGGHNFMVGFTEMAFYPDKASTTLMSNIHIPQFGEEGWVSLAATDACFIPSGLGGEYVLHPVNDYHIPSEGDITYIIEGSTATTLEDIKAEATYLEMNCDGMQSLGLRGSVQFPKSTLLKEDERGEILEERAIATFTTILDRNVAASESVYSAYGESGIPEEAGLQLMLSLDVDPFQIAGLQGWGFEVAEAWLDVSDFENPPGIQFPAAYDDPNISISANGAAIMQPTWTGIYIKEAEMKTPPEFLGTTNREGFSVNDLIVDPLVTMTVAVEDILGQGVGEVDGWSLSLDSLFITIVQNQLQSGGFSGLIGLPITKENTYLRYTALIEDQDIDNALLDPPSYSISIEPENNIELPFLIAKASLSRNTYVMCKFTPNNASQTYCSSYFEGGMGISSDLFVPEDGSSPPPLYLPVVDFNFSYHSQNSFTSANFGFLEQLAAANNDPQLAEYDLSFGNQFSQESFAGFPINIEEAGLIPTSGNTVKFKITPRVSLAGNEGGIAGSVGINIESQFTTIRGEKKLKFNRITVSSLDIYSEIHGLTMEGSVEFYNNTGGSQVGTKGARGDLQVMLPMGIGAKLAAEFGTQVTNVNAAFGTAQNYNYWYIDGLVYLGEVGMPIAPAIGLYGLGGGVFVNMTRGSGAMSQGEVNGMLSSVNDAPPNSGVGKAIGSGSLPSPSFGSYGLKLAATLGTYPVSATLNMDVSVYGEFSKNTGLSMIEIAGDAYMFTPLSLRNKANFWASAALRWENSNGKSNFDGLVDVYVNVGLGNQPILYGNPNNQNKMVSAAFHAEQGGSENWYFYAGTADDRAQLNLRLITVAQIQAYLMMGHGLPSDLPIPARVAYLMANSSKGDGDNKLTDSRPVSSGGDKRGTFETLQATTGSGIAFGAEGSLGVEFKAVLIYARVAAFLGFDINITKDENRVCYIPGEGNVNPGINGWYARGQVYAGIEGAVGIEFRFAGKDYDLPLFELGAAMMLSGGGPDPMWVEGRAGIAYSVLKGAVKGTKTFAITMGDVCNPVSSDPFAGLEIIYENFPADGETGVSVFVDPSVNFILPMDEEFTLPVAQSDGSTKDMTVILQVDYFNVKKSGVIVPEKSQTFDNSGQNITIQFDEILDEMTDYTGNIKVIGYERKSSGDVRLKNNDNTNWYEDRTWVFKTGRTPYPIPDEEIVRTIPIRRQQYYMQGDNVLNAGFIEFTVDMKSASGGYFPEDTDTWDYSYYIRWQDLEGNEPVIYPLDNVETSNTVDQIIGVIPDLLNATIYSCQLVRKKTRKSTVVGMAQNSFLGVNKVINYSWTNTANELSTSTDVSIDIPPLPGDVEAANEDIIYSFYFRTSQFDFMRDKLATVTLNPILTNPGAYTGTMNAAEIEVFCDEDFDKFEIKGEKSGGTIITAPRLKIGTEEPMVGSTALKRLCEDAREAWQEFDRDTDEIHEDTHTERYTYNFGGQIGNVTKTLSGLSESPPAFMDIDLSASSMYFAFNDEITGYRAALSDEQIENAWTNANEPSGSSTMTGSFTNYGFATGLPTATSATTSVAPKIIIDYELHFRLNDEIDNLRDWGQDIEGKTHSVPFTYPIPNSPTFQTITTNKVVNKWSDYLDDNLPSFKPAIDELTVNKFGLNNYLGRYKLTFGINSSYDAVHLGSAKESIDFNLD